MKEELEELKRLLKEVVLQKVEVAIKLSAR